VYKDGSEQLSVRGFHAGFPSKFETGFTKENEICARWGSAIFDDSWKSMADFRA
jgi:hypothetical protein